MFIKADRARQNTNFYLQKLQPALTMARLAKNDSGGSSLAEDIGRNGVPSSSWTCVCPPKSSELAISGDAL